MNNLGRLSVILFSVVVAACSSKEAAAPTSTHHADSTPPKTAEIAAPAPEVPSPPHTLDCRGADKDSGSCVAFAEMDKALASLNAYGAEISLDLMAAQYTRSKKNGLEGDYQRSIDNIARSVKTVLSALGSKQDVGIQSAVDAIQDCVGILGKARKSPPDDYSLRKDECTLRSARLLQSAKLAAHVVGITDTADFNKLHWGDSQETAQKAFAGAPINKNDTVLIYQQTLGSHPVLMALHFTDDKLTSADYWVTEQHSEPATYLDDFRDVDAMLKDKYGKPYYSGMSWRNELFRDNPSRYGLALASGQMRMESDWSLDTMQITHGVYGDNFKVKHGIEYTSKEFAWEVKQATKAKDASAL